MSDILKRVFDNIDPEAALFVQKSIRISDRIHQILIDQNKTQKDLAVLLGKKESEISKWLTGTHNYTLKTISKIENVLKEKIIVAYDELEEELNNVKKTVYVVRVNGSQMISMNPVNTSVKDMDFIDRDTEDIHDVFAKYKNESITIPQDDEYCAQPA